MFKNLGGTEILVLGAILPSFLKGKKLRELICGPKSKEESKKAKSSDNKGPKDENDEGGGD